MRYFLIVLAIFGCLLNSFSYAEDDMFSNIDMNFIDTAFDGIKPITNEQLNETINRLTPQPVGDSFKDKAKAFLFGRKYGVQTPPSQEETKIDIGGEKKAIEDIKNGVYYIKLLVNIVGIGGKIIPLGNYKIKEEIVDEKPQLVFYQGNEEFGRLRLRSFEDNLKSENDIAYSRVDIVSDDVVRIVYSTIKDTKCAMARVYKE